jgi:hypothetical protein
VTTNKQWRDVAIAVLGEQPVMNHTGTSTIMRKHYEKFLQDYEARCANRDQKINIYKTK